MNKIKIFAVDDEDYVREILELNFKSVKDFELKTFETARSLLEYLKIEKPDIIISDIIMPDINGIELCKIIKSTPEYTDIYFIMLTAKISVDDKIEGLESGADEYLTKPFKFKELFARIRVANRLISAQRENANLIKELSEKNKKLTAAYNDLAQAQKKIIEIEKLSAIAKISAIITHELKNPLAVIANNLENLKQNISIEKFEDLKKTIDYANEILNKIPKFSSNNNQEPEKINLIELINEALINIRIPSNITLAFDYAEKTVFVTGNKLNLKIVIINLLKNAIEKFEKSGGKINIKCYSDKTEAIIKIIDNGAKIPETLDIFESFVSTKKNGFGLGLTFSKIIIEQHQGIIYYENIDNGVCFTIKLKKTM
ncbi:MAG TPA: response regulator [bacterium]|nr:response regulator [bacterium]